MVATKPSATAPSMNRGASARQRPDQRHDEQAEGRRAAVGDEDEVEQGRQQQQAQAAPSQDPGSASRSSSKGRMAADSSRQVSTGRLKTKP